MNSASNSLKTAIFIGSICLAISISGQTQNENNERPAPRRQFGAAAAGRFSPGFERVLSALTEEQRASMREAMATDRERIRELEQKIGAARRDLFELGLRQNFDEAAVREKAIAAAKLDAEMTVLRVKAFSQIKPPLSAEQIQKIKDSARAELGDRQGEALRRRHDIPRDENGLPLKEQAPAKNGADKE